MIEKKSILVLIGLATVLLIAGLIYRFYPYFLYKNTSNLTHVPTNTVKEPTQPLSLSDYVNYLNSLNRSEPAAVASGVRVLERSILNFSTNEADQSFLALNTFYIEALNHCNETFWQNESLVAKLRTTTQRYSKSKLFEYLNKPSALQKDPEIKNLVQQISSCGFILSTREGDFYFAENPDFFYNRFSKYLSESLRDFLNLRRQEATEGFAEDAGLQISFSKIGERIINWELYIDKYPDSPLQELANYHYHLYLGTFLFGMDNSRTFEQKRLKPEIKKVYENFKLRFANTKSGSLISRYYEILRSDDFKYTKAAEGFLRNNHVQILPGIQP